MEGKRLMTENELKSRARKVEAAWRKISELALREAFGFGETRLQRYRDKMHEIEGQVQRGQRRL